MEELNLVMTLYLVDTRPLEVMQPLMEQILSCRLQMRETDDRIDPRTFDGLVFGIAISFSLACEWTEGYVYRLSGSTLDQLYAPQGKQVFLDSHVSRLLHLHGISTVMTPAEFSDR